MYFQCGYDIIIKAYTHSVICNCHFSDVSFIYIIALQPFSTRNRKYVYSKKKSYYTNYMASTPYSIIKIFCTIYCTNVTKHKTKKLYIENYTILLINWIHIYFLCIKQQVRSQVILAKQFQTSSIHFAKCCCNNIYLNFLLTWANVWSTLLSLLCRDWSGILQWTFIGIITTLTTSSWTAYCW